MPSMATQNGNRGKWAEKRVKLFLKSRESATCTHHRFPDARAGSFTVTPCDFMVMQSSFLSVIEVKEVAHDYRLPHGNFSIDQVARMRAFKSAGARAVVVIYSSTAGCWRVIDIDFFIAREGGSWDFRNYPLLSEAEAFKLMIKDDRIAIN